MSSYNYPPSSNESHTIKGMHDGPSRDLDRTPSPTPSELVELQTAGAFDWKRLRDRRFWLRRKWLWYYVVIFIVIIGALLLYLFHKQIVQLLTPAANWMHKLRFGWLIPVGILFVISFPPLFGHEIVAVLCGLVWGLGPGFGIVALGTFLGEVGNFYAFKFLCRARGEKLEREKLPYALLARVVRDGGFKVALIARLSIIPGHFTTAVFSICGMGIVVFSIAAILSLPKQFVIVYLGVILEQSGTGSASTRNRILNAVVILITGLITILAAYYILREMGKVKADVIYLRRKARQAKLRRGEVAIDVARYPSSESTVRLNHSGSDLHLPLRSDSPSKNQQWDNERDAESSSSHTQLYAPQPKRPHDALAVPYGGITDGGFQMREVDRDAPPRDSFDSVGWDASSKAGPQSVSHGDAYDRSDPFTDPSTEGNPFGSSVSLPSTAHPAVPPGLPTTKTKQRPPSPSQTPIARQLQPAPGGANSQAAHAPATSEDVTLGSLPSPPWDSAPPAFRATGSEASVYTHRTESTDASYQTARTGRLTDSTDLPYRW